jgi:hypothetical protein
MAIRKKATLATMHPMSHIVKVPSCAHVLLFAANRVITSPLFSTALPRKAQPESARHFSVRSPLGLSIDLHHTFLFKQPPHKKGILISKILAKEHDNERPIFGRSLCLGAISER